MRPYRFYSTRKVLPRNPFKDKNVTDVVPSPGQMIHSFYSPSLTEELTTCFTEKYPSLLGGKPIMPALVRDPKTQEARLQMKSLTFKSVRGVVDWLETFRSMRSSDSTYEVLEDRMIADLVKPSKLTRVNTPLVSQLRELFGSQESRKINSRTLNAMVEQFVNDRELGVFSEDVYLYLLQHHVNSPEKIISIIESIKLHLKSHIDQFSVVEALVLQILVSLKKNELHLSELLVNSFNDLLSEINNRFHIPNCTTQFQPIVAQEILELYIKMRKFTESKRLFSYLISKKFCPSDRVTVSYLKTLSEEVPRDTLKEFALISDFRPIIERAQNPKIFYYLIPLCRHVDEATSLLTIIKTSRNVKEILDVNITSFISRITTLKNDPMITSATLCTLYRMASPFYHQKLPEKISNAFVLAFSRLANYTMAASIMKRDTVSSSGHLLKTIVSNLERGKNNKIPATNPIYEEVFIERYLTPIYNRMNLTSKLDFIAQVHSLSMLSAMLTSEVSHGSNIHFDLLRKILKHGFKNNLLSEVPRNTWEKVLGQVELKPVLEEYKLSLKTLLNC